MLINLSLFAVLSALTCVTAPRSESTTLGVFDGTSPCDAVSRKALRIPATVNCEMIKWNLTLFQRAASLDHSGYELNVTYGIPQPNTNGLVGGGPKVARRGSLTTRTGTRTDPNATIFELMAEGSEGSIFFQKLDHNVLHLLDSDKNLAVGNGGWSYTLSRREPLQQPARPANAAVMSSAQLSSLTSQSSGATRSSVLGRFVGRSPCVYVARELKKPVEAGCRKVKWDLTLYQDSKTLTPTTYKLRGTFYRDQILEGTWTTVRGATVNPAAVVYQLNMDESESPLLFLKADDNILFFLDGARNLMVGNGDFSYTLNRMN